MAVFNNRLGDFKIPENLTADSHRPMQPALAHDWTKQLNKTRLPVPSPEFPPPPTGAVVMSTALLTGGWGTVLLCDLPGPELVGSD